MRNSQGMHKREHRGCTGVCYGLQRVHGSSHWLWSGSLIWRHIAYLEKQSSYLGIVPHFGGAEFILVANHLVSEFFIEGHHFSKYESFRCCITHLWI